MITTRSVLKIAGEDDLQALEARPYPSLVPWRNMYEVLRATATLYGDRPAFTMLGDDPVNDPAQRFTHGEFFEHVTQAANMYAGLGASSGTVIAILSRTHALIPSLLWGAEVAGVASCVNYLLAPRVIAALLESQGASILVCPGPDLDAELWHKTGQILQHTDAIKTVLVLGDAPETPGFPKAVGWMPVEALLARQPRNELRTASLPGPHDRAALFHTGGTTGVPKLVPQTHLNQIHAAWSLAQSFDLSEQDVALNGFPLFHVGGTTTIGMSVLATGGHVVMLSPSGLRNPKVVNQIWALVERHRATFIGGVPTSIGSMSEVPLDGHNVSTVRFAFTGGASLPRAVGERFEKRTGIPLLEQYGMTESVAAITATPLHGRHVRGSVGLRSPFSRVRILRRDTREGWQACAPGEVGSVVVHGPQIIAGYLNPEHNEGCFTEDGELITGDRGYLDENGYLFLTGREKDLIIRGGHNIDPLAIEEVVNGHPNVALSGAVGMPDEYAGEIPVVFVELLPHAHVDMEALEAYIKDHIVEPPARPRHVFIVDAIPVTAVGKIFKPELRDRALMHKLRMLVESLCPNARIAALGPSSADDGAVLTLEAPAADLDTYRSALASALAQLPRSIGLECRPA